MEKKKKKEKKKEKKRKRKKKKEKIMICAHTRGVRLSASRRRSVAPSRMRILSFVALAAVAAAGSQELTSEVRGGGPSHRDVAAAQRAQARRGRAAARAATFPRPPLPSQTFDSVVGGDKPVLVKFYAPWCVAAE